MSTNTSHVLTDATSWLPIKLNALSISSHKYLKKPSFSVSATMEQPDAFDTLLSHHVGAQPTIQLTKRTCTNHLNQEPHWNLEPNICKNSNYGKRYKPVVRHENWSCRHTIYVVVADIGLRHHGLSVTINCYNWCSVIVNPRITDK